MSQEAVERLLGRLITDERFRLGAAASLEAACVREGFRLSPAELRLLTALDLLQVAAFAGRMDPGLCRAADYSTLGTRK
jgi:hypothetical protein